jgi:GABA permease
VLAVEAVAGAEILQRWIDAPTWLMSLVLMGLLTVTNMFSVRSYGEFEFWFASIKVAAIVVFIVIAAGWLLGIGGGDSPGLSNLTDQGGFAPEGVLTLLSGIAIVIFAFVGAAAFRGGRAARHAGAGAGGSARRRLRITCARECWTD